MKISLIGAMASGKTTLGKQVAQNLGWSFYDTDHLLEEHYGCTVSDFFARHGESFFRDAERAILKEVLSLPGNAILATGGGIITRRSNRVLLQTHSLVVFLEVSVALQLRRTVEAGDITRPLLQVKDPQAVLLALRAQRLKWYQSIADETIQVEGQLFEVLVSQIEKLGQRSCNEHASQAGVRALHT